MRVRPTFHMVCRNVSTQLSANVKQCLKKIIWLFQHYIILNLFLNPCSMFLSCPYFFSSYPVFKYFISFVDCGWERVGGGAVLQLSIPSHAVTEGVPGFKLCNNEEMADEGGFPCLKSLLWIWLWDSGGAVSIAEVNNYGHFGDGAHLSHCLLVV